MNQNPKRSVAAVPWYWNRVDLFEGTSPRARDDFMQRSTRVEYRPREAVFAADDLADRVFLLERGTVKIYDLSESGDVVIFWFCAPGDLFGAGGISGATHQAVHGQAMNRCVVRVLARNVFEELISENPRVGLNVIKLVSARLRLASDAASDKSVRRADARLARILLLLSRQCGQDVEHGTLLDIPITHQEMADMVGATRQTVNQTLKQFERAGWLHFDGRRIVIRAQEELLNLFEVDMRREVVEGMPQVVPNGRHEREAASFSLTTRHR